MIREHVPEVQKSRTEIGRRRLSRAALILIGVLLTPSVTACDTSPTTPEQLQPDSSLGLHDNLYTHIPDTSNNGSDYLQDLLGSIDTTSENATIKISTYKIHDPVVADALLRAEERGVNIQIVMDEVNSDNDVVKELQQKLGSNSSADSFIHLCNGSCEKPGEGLHHAKVMTFSDSGKVVVGSTNLSNDNLRESSGADYVTSDPSVYANSVAFVDAMSGAKSVAMVPATNASDISISFSPYTDPDEEPIGKLFREVDCESTSSDGKNASIDIAMYDITWGRRKDIQQLAKLATDGCDVRVIVNGKNDKFKHERQAIADYLESSGASVTYPVSSSFMVHDKLVIARDFRSGSERTTTILGSQNITSNARDISDEATIQSNNPNDYQTALNHIDRLAQLT